MNPPDVHDPLARERDIEPSPGFRADVMRAVHAHASARRSRSLTLDSLWPVAGVASVMVPFLLTAQFLGGNGSQPGDLADAARWLTFTLAGTLASAWWCTRAALRP